MRKLTKRVLVAALACGAMTGSFEIVRAQTEVLEPPCEFKTRWKDAFSKCKSCCDAREFSCPCTT